MQGEINPPTPQGAHSRRLAARHSSRNRASDVTELS
jgi:hypothetical protein